jgi:DNA-binding HxlR family transcriptional regulator
MKTYGQYCPLAKATEILAQRWSFLLLRDLLGGIERFNDLQRGVPLMSPSLLSRRLKEFQAYGLIERTKQEGTVRYRATAAAQELKPVIYLLAAWGQRWVRKKISEDECDVRLLMWDMSLRMTPSKFPPGRTVIAFEYSDGAALHDQDWQYDAWWLLIEDGESELCLRDPGFEVDLYILSDLRTMTDIWMGDIPLRQALDSGLMDLHGDKRLIASMADWFVLSAHARRPRPPEPLDMMALLKQAGV